jgi:hypothetical protein
MLEHPPSEASKPEIKEENHRGKNAVLSYGIYNTTLINRLQVIIHSCE